MLNKETLASAFASVMETMEKNKEYLISLDQQNGDGDLGISMTDGFTAVKNMMDQTEEKDLGKLFQKSSKTFNEAAPSSLGTILSIGFMGMAKALKGRTEAELPMIAEALSKGVQNIMDKAGSEPGEKTILDAFCPAVRALMENQDKDADIAFTAAAKAAAEGSESTKNMKAVHGRAAYYGEGSIGILDGGSVAGKLIFEGIRNSI